MIRLSRNTILALLATGVYAVLATYKVLHHVPWEDEWQMWLTARSQNSAIDVALSSRYDGHPPFWYLVQYVITRFSHDIVWLKVLHVAIASAVVYVIWRYGPFTRLEKVLLPTGYFFFFEYSTISRSYALGVLVAMIAMAMFNSSKRYPFTMCAVLFFLGQISLFSLILSLAIACAVAVDWIQTQLPRRWWVLPGTLATSLLLFYACTRLPPDAMGAELWINGWKHFDPLAAGAHLFDAYLPVPRFTKHWWNTQIIPLGDGARAALGIVVLALAAMAVRRSRAALLLLLVGSMITLGALAFIYTGAMRHWGHFFILFVMAVWLDRISAGETRRMAIRFAIAALLVVQGFAGVVASVFDSRQPFSTVPEAARIIREVGPTLPVAGDYDYVMNALVGELDHPVYFIRSGQWRWFPRFDARRRDPDYAMVDDAVERLARENHSDVLLVLTYSIPLPAYYEPVAYIPPGTVEVEKFYIYRFRYRRGS